MPLKTKPLRDRAWLNTAKDRPCDSCGMNDGTIVFAHKRAGSHAGVGSKPDDWRGLFLCGECHAEQEQNIGGKEAFWRYWPEEWMEERYWEWKNW